MGNFGPWSQDHVAAKEEVERNENNPRPPIGLYSPLLRRQKRLQLYPPSPVSTRSAPNPAGSGAKRQESSGEDTSEPPLPHVTWDVMGLCQPPSHSVAGIQWQPQTSITPQGAFSRWLRLEDTPGSRRANHGVCRRHYRHPHSRASRRREHWSKRLSIASKEAAHRRSPAHLTGVPDMPSNEDQSAC